MKAATEAVTLAKTNAEKSAAAAQVTPEIQKQVDDAAAAMKSTTDAVAAIKVRLAKMQAAKAAPPPQTAAR